MSRPLRIAVVGAGIAGIAAAWMLSKSHDVTLIEANHYVGGHTNTIVVTEPDGKRLPVDTGFIVCNPKTYPLFYRLLAEWGVSLRDSDMSFGYYSEADRLGYVGPSVREFCRKYTNFFKPAFVKMIFEQRRFNRQARVDLEAGRIDDGPLQTYLDRVGASEYLRSHYLLPLAAAVWSSPDAGMLEFPALTFLRFINNHGLLAPESAPMWQTVVGGSQTYVKAFLSRFAGKVLVDAAVSSVQRNGDGVIVRLQRGESMSFDRVVLAAHPDQSLRMLSDASAEERDLLSAWTYHHNPTVLHTDASIMPPDRKLWASWNYYRRPNQSPDAAVPITYYMNRLQGLKTDRDYFVSLNANELIKPESVIYSVNYTHPAYTPRSIAAQSGIQKINGLNRTFYCGAYLRYGFHEDAVASAVAVAEKCGVDA